MKADIELVEEVKRGNKLAFQELVTRHQRTLLRICLRLTRDEELAEDVVQEAFIKAYQKIKSFEGRSAFKSWLVQIAINTARNKLRSLRSDHIQIDQVQLATAAEGSANLEHADLQDLVRQHIDNLPDKQRTALILRVFEDLSFKEIAKIMNCPYDTAKANYRHAIVRLRQSFADQRIFQDWNKADLEQQVAVSQMYKDVEH